LRLAGKIGNSPAWILEDCFSFSVICFLFSVFCLCQGAFAFDFAFDFTETVHGLTATPKR
jgi:hypothetical protein